MVGIGAGLAIAAAGSAVAGGVSAMGAKSAAGVQAAASEHAAQIAHDQYLQTRQDMTPYMQFGQQNLDAYGKLPGQADTALSGALDEAHANIPGQMSQQWLEQQPGYQFALGQGQKGVQTTAASRGLGVSGTAMKAGGDFVTGLASQYYNTAFNQAQTRYSDYSTQFSNTYNKFNQLNSMYNGQAVLGENASAQLGTIGTNAANTQATNVFQAGQATAAGISKAYDSMGNVINSVSSLPLSGNILNKMYPGGTTSTAPANGGYPGFNPPSDGSNYAYAPPGSPLAAGPVSGTGPITNVNNGIQWDLPPGTQSQSIA